MGSFNMTCFASQQTISTGEACRVLPIRQQATYNPMTVRSGDTTAQVFGPSHSTCYYESFWEPVGAFIKAKYNDYGQVELDYDPLVRENVIGFFKYMLREGYVTDKGANEYHDLEFNLVKFIAEKAPNLGRVLAEKDRKGYLETNELDGEMTAVWDYVWEVGQKFRLFADNYKDVPLSVNFALIHEQAYATLLADQSTGKTWHGRNLKPAAFLRSFLTKSEGKFKDSALAKMEVDKPGIDKVMQGLFMSNDLRDEVFYLAGGGRAVSETTMDLSRELCLRLAEGDITENEFIKQGTPLLFDAYVFGGLNKYNLRLTPVVTCGQDYHNELGKQYAKFVQETSQRVSRSCIEARYGKLRPYAMQASTRKQVQKLEEEISEWDSAIECVSITEMSDGLLEVQFECTSSEADLREALQELFKSDALLATSLRKRKRKA